MPTAGDLQTSLAAARAHIAAGEYDDALDDLLAAEIARAGLPDTEFATWREIIDRLYERVKDRRSESTTDYQPVRVLLRRPS